VLNKQSLSLSEARTVVAAAEAFAAGRGLKVAIAVVDQSTHLQHLSRMDGAGLMTADASIARARSAAGTGFPTSFWDHELKENNLFVLSIPGVTGAPGGVPVMADGQCVGGVGVAGGPPDLDAAVAEAGVAALTAERAG
jgi:glc operon protein GlcG